MRITTAHIQFERLSHYPFSNVHITRYIDNQWGIEKEAIVEKNHHGEFKKQTNHYYLNGIVKPFKNIESLLEYLNHERQKFSTNIKSRANSV